MIADLAETHGHKFALERAIFLTLLHRLFVGESDRAADRWREDYASLGSTGSICITFIARWRGELPEKDQDGHTPFAPRCMKDLAE